MPNYVMLQQPNKLEWLERFGNQTGNFMWQMLMAQQAAKMRAGEQERNNQLELDKEERKRQAEANVKPQLYELGGKKFVQMGGKLLQVDEDKDKEDKTPTSIKEWEYGQKNPDYLKFLDKTKGKSEQQGFNLSMDKDGNISVSQGGGQPAGMPLSKGSQADVEKKIFDADASIGRLKDIITSYKPEYQTLATRWSNLVTATKEKMGMPVPEEDKAALQDYSNYRKGAIANFNKEIKEASGATVTEQEAGRVLKGLPNPGTGLFDGDSPTEFESALKQSYKLMSKTKARLMWYRAKGIGAEEFKGMVKGNKVVSLEEMDSIINNRAAQIERELKLREPSAPPQTVNAVVRQILKNEFGVE